MRPAQLLDRIKVIIAGNDASFIETTIEYAGGQIRARGTRMHSVPHQKSQSGPNLNRLAPGLSHRDEPSAQLAGELTVNAAKRRTRFKERGPSSRRLDLRVQAPRIARRDPLAIFLKNHEIPSAFFQLRLEKTAF